MSKRIVGHCSGIDSLLIRPRFFQSSVLNNSYFHYFLVGALEHQFYFPINIGLLSSSQLTNKQNRNQFETQLEINILGVSGISHGPTMILWYRFRFGNTWIQYMEVPFFPNQCNSMRKPLGLRNTGMLVWSMFTVM